MKSPKMTTTMMLALLSGCLFMGCQDVVDSQTGAAPVPTIPSVPGPQKPADKVVVDGNAGPPVASEVGPWPQAVADETEFNFGRMSVGNELEHNFVIRNEGEADLILQAGEPTCKCTAFELSSTSVKPGESAELLVRWKGKFKDNSFQHGGPVYTNDPERSEVRFSVMGIVDADIDVLPNELWSVGTVTDTSPGTMQAVVLSRVHEKISITDIKSDSKYVTAEAVVVPPEKMGEYDALTAWYINVTVSPEMPPGVLEEELHITADCEDHPVTVKVTAQKSGPIRVLPTPGVVWVDSANGLKMEQFPAKEGREVHLNLLVEEAEDAESLQFTSVKSIPAFIEVGLEKIGRVGKDKARYRLSVRIPPGIPRSSRESADPGKIEIQTNHPSGQTLLIKVTYKAF
ncbi:MAG: DUF1573 domain-containing protein [Planctomycetaceae bacterium]